MKCKNQNQKTVITYSQLRENNCITEFFVKYT